MISRVTIKRALVVVLIFFLAIPAWMIIQPAEESGTKADLPRIGDNNSLLKMPTDKLVRLMKTHPHQEVRVEMATLFNTGKLPVEFWFEGLGTICAVRAKSFDEQTGQINPGLYILLVDFMREDIPDKLLQLILYHEYQHLKQMRDPQYREYFCIPEEAEVTRKQVRNYFRREWQASLAESNLAIKLGWEDLEETYSLVKSRNLRAAARRKAELMVKIPGFQPFAAYLRELADNEPLE